MSDWIVYSMDNCPSCNKAFELLQLYGKKFKVVKLGVDMPMDLFKEANPGVRVVPFITHKTMEFTSLIRLGTYLKGK